MAFTDGTTEVSTAHQRPSFRVQRFHLSGPSVRFESRGSSCSIGSHPSNDLILDDPTVSRFHCEIRVGPQGVRLKDLSSRNGTSVDGVSLIEGFLRDGSMLSLGNSTLRFELDRGANQLEASNETNFGPLVGSSLAMRAAFAQLERATASDLTVLLEGETGTGKEGAATTLHARSRRRDAPFVIIDCAALPETLIESELFGHERGAFTGADTTRIGAFEEADGGTIFLDEIGELPLSVQPKLLRVLEQRTVRRVGSNQQRPVDVRLIAATHRDLREEINAERFRSDLYFRLAVVRVTLPPLRSRPEDMPALSERLLREAGASETEIRALCTAEFIAGLKASAWPGNVRELRNYLERARLFRESTPLAAPSPNGAEARLDIDPKVPFVEAKQHAIERFERAYVEALLELHDGKVARAAEAAKMDRAYLYRLLRRYR